MESPNISFLGLWQFFISYAKQTSLDGKYTIFGKCVGASD